MKGYVVGVYKNIINDEKLKEYAANEFFKVNIDIYECDREQACLTPFKRSSYKFETTLVLLHHDSHFCYIRNINNASKSLSFSIASFSSLNGSLKIFISYFPDNFFRSTNSCETF